MPPPVADCALPVDDLEASEADARAHGLSGGLDGEVVEAGLLGAPGLDRWQVEARGAGSVEDGARVELGDADRDREGGRRGVDVDLEEARARGRVVVGPCEDVIDASGRTVQERDVSEDARQPPLVLVLQVARRRPPDDGEHQLGRPARGEQAREVELLAEP